MKGKTGKDCAYKKGGAVDSKPEKEEGKTEKGGMKKAAKVGGEKAKKRLDKFKRGGAVTPKSPLSGAMPGNANNEGHGIKNPGKFKLGKNNN